VALKILLADDSLTFLSAVKQFLAMLPVAEVVGEAHDGQQAIDSAQKLMPDLVLLDIVMPHLNGLDVAKALMSSAHPPRIVFLSMHDNDSYRTAAKDLGVYGYVGKSDFVNQLLPMISTMAEEKAAP
jgi:DNA-binding NarL/FixJ family response regulator